MLSHKSYEIYKKFWYTNTCVISVRNVVILIIIIIVLASGIYFITQRRGENQNVLQHMQPNRLGTSQNPSNISAVTIIAQDLDVPWAIAFLPDGRMLVTERRGMVRIVDTNGSLEPTPAATISVDTQFSGEGGLLGIALHPNFTQNHYVYLYYTYLSQGDNTLNRVVRMKFDNDKLTNEQVLIDKIPGALFHNGGRIKFGPDGYLYVTTGDSQRPSLAQNINSLAGKILRVTDEGKPAPGNPFSNRVYSYGHRNPQGIAWNTSGQLWETEHGPSGGGDGTGNDEVNKIESGKNYGWPVIQGSQTRQSMVTSVKNSTPDVTWAPAGTAFVGNSLFFTGLKGQTLYEAVIRNNEIVDFKKHFAGEYGRLREVVLGPDGMLYITTSNMDGRGTPNANDDKIIRVNPSKLSSI